MASYLSQSGPIPAVPGLVVYDGAAPSLLTLPAVPWQGYVFDLGPGAVTLVGAAAAPVNGQAAGVTMIVGTGGFVFGDPGAGWWFVGPLSNFG